MLVLILFTFIFKVEVSTKSPRSDKQYVWEGESNSSSYTIREETDPAKLIPRGTRLTLHLKVCCTCCAEIFPNFTLAL